MNESEGKPKYFHPSKKTFSQLSWQANCEHYYSAHVFRKVFRFFSFDMRGAVWWTCRTKSDSDDYWLRDFTMLWAQCAYHLLMASLLGSDSKLYKEQKKEEQNKQKHILYLTNLYAYFTIYFYYHFNKYKTTLWFKRKQWVLKRHENAIDIRNINLNLVCSFTDILSLGGWTRTWYSESISTAEKRKRGDEGLRHERD